MKKKIEMGFVTLSGKEGPFFIVPHSGLALDNPVGEIDTGTQSVAYHYIKKYGGSAVFSLFSREREIGIDFWRPLPEDDRRERKYAFFLSSNEEDDEKEKIYKKFWDFVLSQESETIVALHRQLPRVKNHPSMIDVVSFKGRGFSKKKMGNVIDKINEKYEKKFYWMRDEYRQLMLVYVDYFFLKYKENIRRELKGDLDKLISLGILSEKEVDGNITKTLFEESIARLLRKQPDLKVTLDKNFTGDTIGNIIQLLFKDRFLVEFEINQLLSQYYPYLSAKIIHDIISEYRKLT